MIKKSISRGFKLKDVSANSVREEMEREAIKDDGIFSTFRFYTKWLPTASLTKVTLQYYKFDGDGCSWMPMHTKISYRCCPEIVCKHKDHPELGDATLPYICAELLDKASERIKMDMAKKYNAIWSTVKVEACYDYFDVSYEKAYVTSNDEVDTSKWKPVENPYVNATKEAFDQATKEAIDNIDKAYTKLRNKVYAEAGIKAAESMTAQAMEIENTKKTLQRLERLRENSYYGLYPRNAGTTYAFDEKAKEDLKASLEIWKAKADLDIHSPSKELLFNYYNKQHTKEEKEKKDMNITLMVVPEGMSKDFVRKVKANYQSNNSLRLFIASTDIDYSCEHEPIKTKWQLFEKWIKTGYVDIVYFMLGFEKDPDVRAFESFVRGITEVNVPGKIDVRVIYQKDDIENDIQHLRTAYFDEADAQEDLERAGNRVVREAKVLKEVCSLDDAGLDIIKYSKGKIDASDELVINDIMEAAFASHSLDEASKPAKKGGKND